MRIAINIRLWLPGRLDGIGWFTAESVKRMTMQHPEHEFFLLCDRPVDLQWTPPEHVHVLVLHPPARHPVLWFIFFEWSVARVLRKLHIDVFLSTDGWMSLHTQVPTLTVMHDINFEHADDYLKPLYQRYMKYFFPRYARHATRVATVSEFSKRDIADTYGVAPERIDVVYNGANACYRPLSEGEQQRVREAYTEGWPFFIFVGTITKRKNLSTLLRAFDVFKEGDCRHTRLVVVGARAERDAELDATYSSMHHREDVQFIGRLGSEALARLLASAEALSYVSYFEGFGIPIVEAFQAETAVITGDCSSMPEIAGDAALLVSPTDVEGLCHALVQISTQPALRAELVAKGRERRALFHWDRTAALLWDSLLRTVRDANM